MITWLLVIPAVLVCTGINIIIGCYVVIRLGFGPPDWKTALNLAVPVTTLQDRLNEGRDWISKKAPKIDQILDRLHVPKPIIIVDVPEEEENENEQGQEAEVIQKPDEANSNVVGETADEPASVPTENFSAAAVDQVLKEQVPNAPPNTSPSVPSNTSPNVPSNTPEAGTAPPAEQPANADKTSG